MAGAKRKAKQTVAKPDTDVYVAKALTEIERSGFIAVSKLGPAAGRSLITKHLVATGLEVSGTRIRRPLAPQLLAALENGALLALNSIKLHLPGASAAEIKRTVQDAVKDGHALVVLRGKQSALTSPKPGLLAPEELSRLKRSLDAVQKAITAALASKPPACLLLSDVEELLPRLNKAPAPSAKPSGALPAAPSSLTRIMQAVREAGEGSLGLAFVPRVISKLAAEIPKQQALQALLDAEKAGRIELRPEGGLSRLSQAELDLCPKGALGIPLAWARPVEHNS